jgi:hypothetical protein
VRGRFRPTELPEGSRFQSGAHALRRHRILMDAHAGGVEQRIGDRIKRRGQLFAPKRLTSLSLDVETRDTDIAELLI